MKKKISIVGLVLGSLLGAAVALIFGKWLFWLGIGLALGVVIGSAGTRRNRLQRGNVEAGNLVSR